MPCEKGPTFTVIREIKTIMRYHDTPSRMAMIEKADKASVHKDVKK